MRTPVHRHVVWVDRIDADQAPVWIAVAKKCARCRRKLADLPAAIKPPKHLRNEFALKIRSSRQLAGFNDGPMHGERTTYQRGADVGSSGLNAVRRRTIMRATLPP